MTEAQYNINQVRAGKLLNIIRGFLASRRSTPPNMYAAESLSKLLREVEVKKSG